MVSLLSSAVWQRVVLYVGIVYQRFTGTFCLYLQDKVLPWSWR